MEIRKRRIREGNQMQFLQEVTEGTEVRGQVSSDQLVNRLDSN